MREEFLNIPIGHSLKNKLSKVLGTVLLLWVSLGSGINVKADSEQVDGPLSYHKPFLGRQQLPHDLDWLKQVRIAAYTQLTTDQDKEQFLKDIDVDFMDWYCTFSCNRGNYMRTRGIRVAGPEEFEYQEALHLSKSDTFAIFSENGIAGKLDGTPATFPPTLYGGSYFMCHNAPKWHEMVKQGLIRLVPFGDSISQDNIGCPLNKGQGNFCRWCNIKFHRYLRQRFSTQEIRKLGIVNLDAFDARAYIQDQVKAGSNAKAIEYPLVREYIRFQYISEADAWEDMMRIIRKESAQLGLPMRAAYGNQYGGWGIWPFATMLSSRADVVWIECNCFQPTWGDEKQAWNSLVYKIGAASGHFNRPVWTWPIGYSDNQYFLKSRMKLDIGKSSSGEPYIGYLKKFPVQLVLCEGLAEGGMVIMRPGDHVDTPLYKLHVDYARFVSQNRDLFAQRNRYANAAIIYSFPTWMWRNFSSLSVGDASREYLPAMARILEEAHIPYEARIFGHPDVWDDTEELASLRKYDMVLLPSVDCISDRQAKAIRSFVRGGGCLVICGQTGTRDEDFHMRPVSILDDMIQAAAKGVNVGKGMIVQIYQDDMKTFLTKKSRLEGYEKVKSQIVSALKDRAFIETSAPQTVWINSWLQSNGRRLCVHFLNYDADVEADTMIPAKNVKVSLKTPRDFTFDRVLWIPFGHESQVLSHRVDAGRVFFTVPEVDMYGIAVLTSGHELKIANTIDAARRVCERLNVTMEGQGGCPAQLRTLVTKAEKSLRSADDTTAATAAQEALTSGTKLLDETIAQSIRTEWETREQTVSAAVSATRAFDFGNGSASPGWIKIKSDMKYDRQIGFGWDDVRGLRSSSGNTPDTLYGDSINSDVTRSFQTDLTNGEYVVTILNGHPNLVCTRASTAVMAQGVTRLLGMRSYGGVFFNRSFSVEVSDGRLNLTFPAAPALPLVARTEKPNPFAWNVCGVLIHKTAKALTPDCELHDTMAEGNLKNWAVIGPFDDSTCEGMEIQYPPEKKVDLTASYEGCDSQKISWQIYTAAPGITTIPFRELFDKEAGVVAFAHTKVFVPETIQARLLFGSTGIGQVWLNQQPVLCDYALSGLMAVELVKNVKLRRGWNDLLVKVCSKWGGPWAFSASILDNQNRSIDGMRTSPSGKADMPTNLATVYPLAYPAAEAESGILELNTTNNIQVTFENSTPLPMEGSIELSEENKIGSVLIEPYGDVFFAGPAPGRKISKTFQVQLLKVSSEAQHVNLVTAYKTGNRTRTTNTRLKIITPQVRIKTYDPVKEPHELVVDNMDDPFGWSRADSESVDSIVTDQNDTKEGKASISTMRHNNGDGIENFGRIQKDFKEGTDWTAYNTLRYWVKVADEDPSVKQRPICVVLNNRDSGGYQALARHEVPVGQWTLIEDDISSMRRDNVSSLVPHLYEANLKQRTAYTWHLDDMRLLKSSKLNPVEESQNNTDQMTARLYVSNPSSTAITASLTLTFPEGWRCDLPPDTILKVAQKKAWCASCRITPPSGTKPSTCPVLVKLFFSTGVLFETKMDLQSVK